MTLRFGRRAVGRESRAGWLVSRRGFLGGVLLGESLVDGAAGLGSDSDGVAEVLGRARQASRREGIGDREGVVVVEGPAVYLGTKGRYEFRFDSRGRFVERIEGPLGRTIGFDGTTAWEVDS